MKILVTGGTHGIGKSIVNVLGQEKHEIYFFSRSSDRVKKFSEELSSQNIRAKGFVCDVLKKNELEVFWEMLFSISNGFDVLINNVGGGGRWGTDIPHETPLNIWQEVLDKNLYTAEFFTLKCVPAMIQNRFGRVIFITSIYAHLVGGRTWFNIAKVAENIFMRSMARQSIYASNGITFNSISPGGIMIPNTGWDRMKNENPNEFKNYINSLPAKKMGEPEDIAYLCRFLISDYASHINGATIRVDGGESIVVE